MLNEPGDDPADGYLAVDRERWVAEAPKSRARTPFERDRARIVHSSALRRLGAKTQVLGPSTDDFVRTRLTHTLEVAQVGREIGKALGCDPDVVDTACLAHDLGHPPFGHNGERALAEMARSIGGFEGNAQTLRLLTRLEPKVVDLDGRAAGLNLTRASLDASVKYPWRHGEGPVSPGGRRTPKFGVYDDDRPVFGWLREGAPEGRQCLEAQVMDLADDISYSVHDVEDAVVGGKFDLAVLTQDDERAMVAGAVHEWYGTAVGTDALLAAADRLNDARLWVHGFDGSRRALAALKRRDVGGAAKLAAKAIDSSKTNGNAYYAQAQVLMASKKPDLAKVAAESALKYTPQSLGAKVVLADVDARRGNADDARRTLTTVLLADSYYRDAKRVLYEHEL